MRKHGLATVHADLQESRRLTHAREPEDRRQIGEADARPICELLAEIQLQESARSVDGMRALQVQKRKRHARNEGCRT